MNNDFFCNYLEKISKSASKQDTDYAFVDGVMKKGVWRTMPNGIHVFIVDDKIQAGPVDTIGKKPSELDWDEIHESEKKNFNIPYAPREGVSQKYTQELIEANSKGKGPRRDSALDKVMYKMQAEDDFHVIFFNVNKQTPVLDELAKDFSSFGKFPIEGSHKDQVIFYKDRVVLLNQIKDVLPAVKRNDVIPQIEHINDLLNELDKRGPQETPKTETIDNPEKSTKKEESPIYNSLTKEKTLNTLNDIVEKIKLKQQKSNRQEEFKIGRKPKYNYAPKKETTKKENKSIRNGPIIRENIQPAPSVPISKAKSELLMQVESATRSLFTAIVVSICKEMAKKTKKNNSWEDKLLFNLTKSILSDISYQERDNFFETFGKEISRRKL